MYEPFISHPVQQGTTLVKLSLSLAPCNVDLREHL